VSVVWRVLAPLVARTNALQHLLAKVEPINKMPKLAKALMWNFIQTMQFDYIHMRSRETPQVQTGPLQHFDS